MMNRLPGVEVVGVDDSEPGAIAWLDARDWDAVVVDLKIREGSGIRVLEHLRAPRFADRIKVVLTNYGYAELEKRCLSLGADAFFDKSSDIDRFLAFLRSAASRREDGGHGA